MHFKGKIWEYCSKYPQGISSKGKLIAYKCDDPFYMQIIKSRLKNNYFQDDELKVSIGSELSSTWVEDNFLSLGLFGNSESYYVLNAEDIKDNTVESFERAEEFILDGRILVLVFNKDSKLFKKLAKSKAENIETVQITAPAFWEDKNLLNFLCEEKKINLPINLKSWILSEVTFSSVEYSLILDRIKINFTDFQGLAAADLATLIGAKKIDQFHIVELLARKNMPGFYKSFIEVIESGQDLFQLLYLMQSHFIKMFDTSYTEEKKKLSKYDQGIISQSKNWEKKDIIKVIDYMGELLILAKSKSNQLERRVKSDQLKLLKF